MNFVNKTSSINKTKLAQLQKRPKNPFELPELRIQEENRGHQNSPFLSNTTLFAVKTVFQHACAKAGSWAACSGLPEAYTLIPKRLNTLQS